MGVAWAALPQQLSNEQQLAGQSPTGQRAVDWNETGSKSDAARMDLGHFIFKVVMQTNRDEVCGGASGRCAIDESGQC
jgi:hypothetical protein